MNLRKKKGLTKEDCHPVAVGRRGIDPSVLKNVNGKMSVANITMFNFIHRYKILL
jgi:hypothetical protein